MLKRNSSTRTSIVELLTAFYTPLFHNIPHNKHQQTTKIVLKNDFTR